METVSILPEALKPRNVVLSEPYRTVARYVSDCIITQKTHRDHLFNSISLVNKNDNTFGDAFTVL